MWVCIRECVRVYLLLMQTYVFKNNILSFVHFLLPTYKYIFLWLSEIDRAFKQFVFESMDLATTDPNGFLLTREAEGLEHSSIPWDDPYPFFKGMIPHEEKVSKVELLETPSEERSGWWHMWFCFPLFALLFGAELWIYIWKCMSKVLTKMFRVEILIIFRSTKFQVVLFWVHR